MGNAFYENAEAVGSSTRQPRTIVAVDMHRGLSVGRALGAGCDNGEVSAATGELFGAAVVCRTSPASPLSNAVLGGSRPTIRARSCSHAVDDASFDLVFMTEVLEHLFYPDRVLGGDQPHPPTWRIPAPVDA